MSVNPQAIAQMLMGQGQGPMQQTPQQSPGAALMQKIMMIQALKNAQNPQQQQSNDPNQAPQVGLPGQVPLQGVGNG